MKKDGTEKFHYRHELSHRKTPNVHCWLACLGRSSLKSIDKPDGVRPALQNSTEDPNLIVLNFSNVSPSFLQIKAKLEDKNKFRAYFFE